MTATGTAAASAAAAKTAEETPEEREGEEGAEDYTCYCRPSGGIVLVMFLVIGKEDGRQGYKERDILAINLCHTVIPSTKGLRDGGERIAGVEGNGRHFWSLQGWGGEI